MCEPTGGLSASRFTSAYTTRYDCIEHDSAFGKRSDPGRPSTQTVLLTLPVHSVLSMVVPNQRSTRKLPAENPSSP